jgi:hypothetical protein
MEISTGFLPMPTKRNLKHPMSTLTTVVPIQILDLILAQKNTVLQVNPHFPHQLSGSRAVPVAVVAIQM